MALEWPLEENSITIQGLEFLSKGKYIVLCNCTTENLRDYFADPVIILQFFTSQVRTIEDIQELNIHSQLIKR